MANLTLTVAECAERLGVSHDYVRDRIKRGQLRAMRSLGRGYRIRPEWVDAFAASLEVQTGAPAPSPALPGLSPRRKPRPAGEPGPVFHSVAEAREGLKGGTP